MNRWDQRYQASQSPGEACWVLKNNLHLLPDTGRSLDLACGLGANALLLAEQAFESHAWDNSSVALRKLEQFAYDRQLLINTLQRDVEKYPPAPKSFHVIVISQFLFRPMFPFLAEALVPGGLLFYQTFHCNKLSQQGPTNSNYLLKPGELLQALASLQLVFYREDADIGSLDEGLRDCSYYVGRRPL